MEYFYPLIIVLHIVASVMVFYVYNLPKGWKGEEYTAFVPDPHKVFSYGANVKISDVEKYLTDFYNPAVRFNDAREEFRTLHRKIADAHSGWILALLILLQFFVWRGLDLGFVWTLVIAILVSVVCILIGYLIFRFGFKKVIYAEIDLDRLRRNYNENAKARIKENVEKDFPNIDENVLWNDYVIRQLAYDLYRDLPSMRKKHLVSSILLCSIFILPLFFIPLF